jgi:hypothetical protein
VSAILKRLRVKANDRELVKKLKMEDERLRQKVAALVARIRGYPGKKFTIRLLMILVI